MHCCSYLRASSFLIQLSMPTNQLLLTTLTVAIDLSKSYSKFYQAGLDLEVIARNVDPLFDAIFNEIGLPQSNAVTGDQPSGWSVRDSISDIYIPATLDAGRKIPEQILTDLLEMKQAKDQYGDDFSITPWMPISDPKPEGFPVYNKWYPVSILPPVEEGGYVSKAILLKDPLVGVRSGIYNYTDEQWEVHVERYDEFDDESFKDGRIDASSVDDYLEWVLEPIHRVTHWMLIDEDRENKTSE